MPALVTVLTSVLSSIVVRVFLALGIGIVSYSGLQLVLEKLKGWVFTSMSGMPQDMYNLALMAGLGVALGYIFGAYTFVITYQLTSKLVFGMKK
ncbi:hypothetical protein BGI36_08975 [Snodgrassella communis]|jgi:hypothetical protein|uniref:DUF2523 domain-containing protein n=1 Tax=Snodgrassella communis TaxID=2946699 RepID=UPI000C1E40ED|nr:DUF2523 domain-containing protein [Snodgrassella communis]PIT19974.1 hypothetical protein BGI36_08975 [Snodgrassella communis]PIT20849.1 hypothetical protein BGI35_06725 [Snodgrassella communis]